MSRKAASGLFLGQFDTPDEIDLLSAQVRRGLNCARRGLEGFASVSPPGSGRCTNAAKAHHDGACVPIYQPLACRAALVLFFAL